MSGSDGGVQDGRAVSSGEEPASAPVIGTLQTVTGSVTVTRANLIVAGPCVGHPVYEGDILETGDDGLVAVAFVDGTSLHLYDNGHMVLDEFSRATKSSSSSALIRIAKGVFGLIAGKLAANGSLRIETPFAQLRSTKPAVGIGSVALGVFTFALIRELQAESADVAYTDDETVNDNDLKHGVYEVTLTGENGGPPRVIIVDKTNTKVHIHKKGSGGGFSVDEVALTPEEMKQNVSAYAHTYTNYQAGLGDTFIEQYKHAYNATQPGSNPGGTGSSTSYALLSSSSISSPPQPQTNTGGNTGGSHGGSGNTGTSGSTGTGPGQTSTYTDPASWYLTSGSKWDGSIGNWNDGLVPGYQETSGQDVIINTLSAVTVTIDDGATTTIPWTIGYLEIGPSNVLDIVGGGALTVNGIVDDYGLIKANSTGSDPTLTFDGPSVTVENLVSLAGQKTTIFTLISGTSASVTVPSNVSPGEIEALGPGTAVNFLPYINVNTKIVSNIIVDNLGIIAADDSGDVAPYTNAATVLFEQATVTNEVSSQIVAENHGILTFTFNPSTLDPSSVDNYGTIAANDYGAVSFEQSTVTNEAAAWIMAQNGGTLAFDGGSLDNAGTVAANDGTVSFEQGITVTNEVGGLIIAENDGILILDAGNTITGLDSGLLEATSGGEIDVKDSGIYNSGTDPLAGTDPAGILVDGSGSELLVDVTVLTLNGGGALTLTGGTITGQAVSAGDTLVNVDNTISGFGTISNLQLTNDFIIAAENGTLTLDGVIVTNNDVINVDTTPATLLLDDGTVITGGAMTIGTAGELDVEHNDASDPDATLNGVTVTNDNTAEGIAVGLTSAAVLLVDDGTSITGGAMTIGTAGEFDVEHNDTSDPDATLDDVIVTDNNAGDGSYDGIEISDATSGAILTLDDGTVISGGTMAIEFGGVLAITDATGATLDDVIVDDDGIGTGANAGIYVASGVLTLDGGTQIQGGGPFADRGTLTITSSGELQIIGAGAALDGVNVTDSNTSDGIDVSGAILTLNDSTSISGGTLTVESTTGSELQITAGTGADGATPGGATLDAVSVADNSTSTVTPGIDVASGAVLHLEGGTTITGVSGATMTLAGTLESDSDSNTISNLTVTDIGTSGDPSQLTVVSGTLTLSNDTFTFPTGDPSDGVIEITVDSGATLVLENTNINDAIVVGTVHVPSDSSIETINSNLAATIASGATLTLTDEDVTAGTTFDDQGTILIATAGASPHGAIFDGVIVDDDTTATGSMAGIVVSGAVLTLEGGTQFRRRPS